MVTCGEYARQNNWEKKQDKIIGKKKKGERDVLGEHELG